MNKWRRQHKQYLARALKRHRAIRAFMRRVVGSREAAVGLSRIQILRSTPAKNFEGGLPAKAAAIAMAALNTHDAIKKAMESIR